MTTRIKKQFGKRRNPEAPYAVYTDGIYRYKVLKLYGPDNIHGKLPYARVYLATTSPYTFGSDELGDGYISETILRRGVRLVESTPEWAAINGVTP